MSKKETLSEVFQLAITAEEAAENLYRHFAKLFAQHPEVAHFWKTYADEEAGHAHYLRKLYNELPPERLAERANSSMLKITHKLRRRLIKSHLNEIQTLEDAYQLASEFENSEVNSLFMFILSNFTPPERLKSQALMRSVLNEHIHKILELPAPYNSRAVRQEIKALRENA